MIRRFFRIAPLYYVVLLVAFWFRIVPSAALESGIPLEGGDEAGVPATRLDARFLWMHLSFLFGLFPSFAADNIIPDWSLSLEKQFYPAFPFLVLLMARIGTAAFFFVCCLVSAIACSLVGCYAGSPPGIPGWYPQPSILVLKLHVFAVGVVAASVCFNGLKELRSLWYLPSLILFALTGTHNYARRLGAIYWLIYLCALMPASSKVLTSGLSSVNRWCESGGSVGRPNCRTPVI